MKWIKVLHLYEKCTKLENSGNMTTKEKNDEYKTKERADFERTDF